MGAERELVGGEDPEAGARRIGEHCRRGRGEGGSVVARLQMGGLIVEALAGRCQCVSRWPGHAALPRGWWKRAFGLRQPECGASRVRPGGARAAIRTFRGTVNYGFALGLALVEAMQYGLYDGDEDPDE